MCWKAARAIRPGDRIAGVLVVSVGEIDGWIEVAFDSGRVGIYRAGAKVLVD